MLFITDTHLLKYASQLLCVFIAPPHTSEALGHLYSGTQLVLGANC